MSPRKMQEEECPDRETHTPDPWSGSYRQWEKWAEEMSVTHRQTRCKTCGLWVIWVPKTRRAVNA